MVIKYVAPEESVQYAGLNERFCYVTDFSVRGDQVYCHGTCEEDE